MQPLRRRLGQGLLPCAAILALTMLTQHAQAQLTSAQQSALRANCRSDFFAHCSSTTPGSKDALVCLQKNVASLSPGCKTAVSATMPPPPAAAAPPPKAAPPPAAAKAAPPPAAAPKPAAAPPPKAAPPQRRAAQQNALNKACGNDYLAHCASVRPGGKEAVACLRQHAMELSVPCKRVLSAMIKPSRPAPPRAVRVAPPPAAAPPPPAAPAPVAAGPTPKQLKALKFTCRRDFRALCRGVPPGGPAAFSCLAGHARRLSQNCRTSVRAIQQSAPTPPPAAAVPAPAPAIPVARIQSMSLRERLAIVRACDRDQAVICPAVRAGGGRLIICLASHAQALSPRCGRALRRALY